MYRQRVGNYFNSDGNSRHIAMSNCEVQWQDLYGAKKALNFLVLCIRSFHKHVAK